jgi:hypothetical protein
MLNYAKSVFPLQNSIIFCTFVKKSNMQNKSTYRFVSLKEPSLRELSMIMKEVAVEAKEKSRIAEQQFFREIVEQIKRECK